MKALGLRKAITSFLPPAIPTQATGDCCKIFLGREEWEAMERVRQGPRSSGEALWCGGWGDQHSRFPAVLTP